MPLEVGWRLPWCQMGILTGIVLIAVGVFLLWLAIKSSSKYFSTRLSCASVVVIIGGLSMIGTSAWNFASASFFPPTPTQFHALSNYISPTVDPTADCIIHSSCARNSIVRSTQTIDYRPITWKELASFLSDDHTNWNNYVPDYYVCLDFSIALVENAGKQNIKAWIVGVEFYNQEEGHAFVAFETTDLGVVFIEPQSDYRFTNPKVGKPLCDLSTGIMCMGTISSIEYLQCDHSHYCNPYTP
jgi:hypothetical protein